MNLFKPETSDAPQIKTGVLLFLFRHLYTVSATLIVSVIYALSGSVALPCVGFFLGVFCASKILR